MDPKKRITFSKILSHPLFSPFQNYTEFEDYSRVYLDLERNQKLLKDEVHKIPEQHES